MPLPNEPLTIRCNFSYRPAKEYFDRLYFSRKNLAFFYENLYRQDDATRLDRLGIVDEEFVGDGSSVSTSRKSVYFCMYTMHTARVWQAAYPVTTRRLPDTCIINARDDEDATLARARSPTDYLCRENETGERNIRKSGSRKGWDEEESDERREKQTCRKEDEAILAEWMPRRTKGKTGKDQGKGNDKQESCPSNRRGNAG